MDYAALIHEIVKDRKPQSTVYPVDFLDAAGKAVASRVVTADEIIAKVRKSRVADLAKVSDVALKAAIYRAARKQPGYIPRHKSPRPSAKKPR